MSSRRFLIATAIANYPKEPRWNRAGLADARQKIIDLFTGELGYRHVTDVGLDPTKDQLTTTLRSFCRSRRPDDLVAVYIAGHGELLDGDRDHVLLTADTDPRDVADALPTIELVRKMLRDTGVRRLLLMLDTCYSGQGGNELVADALARITKHWADDEGAGLVVVTSAQPAEQAQTGAFPDLLRDAVHNRATAGNAPAELAVPAVVKAINNDQKRPGFQKIGWIHAGLTGDIPPFLVNPRHHPRLTDVDLDIQQATEWEVHAERREVEFRRRLLVRAMANYIPDGGWWFAGRHAALIDLTAWLREPDERRTMLAVTAGPGSGKTAVLGLVAALTHPERRATVPLDGLGLPSAAIPDQDMVDVAIYAQNLTTDQVRQGIAASARVRADTVGGLLERLPARDRPYTVLLDALDEAADPDHLCGRLLRPLADHAQGRIRLLVGTRPHLLPRLGLRREDSIDLDDPRYADLPALTTYTMRGLLESAPNSPFPRQPPHRLRRVAKAVAEAANPSFLVARITSNTLAAAPDLPDPNDPAWRDSLPRLPGEAMRQDLATRLGEDAERARDLLRPLAFAEGQGLPWEDIWAALASRISGRTYTDDDLLWLRRRAGSYVVEATEAGRSAYRLYHQALAEHLRDGIDHQQVSAAFTHVLISRVPTTLAGRDWTRAHPYALRHLAAHAAECGRIDDLITDTDYLVRAEPDTLLAALHHVATDDGRLTCSIYRASAEIHRHLTPIRRRQVLATDAARFGAVAQQRSLAEPLEWPPRWATGRQTSPALRATFLGVTSNPNALTCTIVDGRQVAVTANFDGTARVRDLTTGSHRATLTGHEASVNAVACTTIDGEPVAVTASDDETVRVWDLTTGSHRATLTGHDDPVTAVACTTIDGQPVAVTAGADTTVRVWDLATGTHRATLTGHDASVNAVACTTIDGQPVAVTSSYKSVRVWDLTTGTHRATLTGHDNTVLAVACTTIDGQPVAVTAGADTTVRVWDLATGTHRATFTGHEDWVTGVACTMIDGRPLAVTGGRDATVRVWDLTTGTHRATFTGHEDWVTGVACTIIDGQSVAVTATASDDETVRVWDLTTFGHREAVNGHSATVSAVACTAIDGQPVAITASEDNTVRIWDLATGTHRATLTGHDNTVTAVACTTIDGHPTAITASDDKTVRIWDLTTGTHRATLTGHDNTVLAVACTTIDDQPVAVTASTDKTVRIWDLTTGTQHATLTGHDRWVTAMACTTIDGHTVAVTASYDKTVRIWDLTTGTHRATLTGHDASVNAVACTTIDDQPVAVTASTDKTVRVWDLTTSTHRATLTRHDSPVNAVACTTIDDQPVAVTASIDKTVRVWDLISSAQLAVFDFAGFMYGALAIGPEQEIVIGTGWDIVVLDHRSQRPAG